MLLPDIFNDLPDERFDDDDAEKNAKYASLAFIPLLFWLPAAARRNSEYCRYASNQALILFLVYILAAGLSALSLIFLSTTLMGMLLFALFAVVTCLMLYVNFACRYYVRHADPRTLPFVKGLRLIK